MPLDEATVRRWVLTAFEYSYLHDSWVNPLAEALDGVTAEEALRRPHHGDKSIWEIVLHLAVWNENIVERVQTGEKTHPQEGAWPALPPRCDEAAWEEAKERLWRSIAAMRALVETKPLEEIDAAAWGVGDVLCRFLHLAYHGGQITKMREFIRD